MKYFHDYYILSSIIGYGYNSTIYKVYNKKTHEYYACKKITILKNNYEKIKNEIKILEMLKFDDDFIKLYEYFVDEFYYWLILELADGVLINYFDNNNLYENDVKIIFKKILNSIKKLHQIDIIHLDIKPNNILYVIKENKIKIKISDFGNSVYNYDFIDNNNFTPEYSAPEVFTNIISSKNDIYSLGYMFYKLLMEKIAYDDVIKNKILFNNKYNKKLHEYHKNWNKISYNAKDFINNMIITDFKLRPDINKCIKHKWLK